MKYILKLINSNINYLNLDKHNRTNCVNKCKKKDCIIEQFKLKISYKVFYILFLINLVINDYLSFNFKYSFILLQLEVGLSKFIVS